MDQTWDSLVLASSPLLKLQGGDSGNYKLVLPARGARLEQKAMGSGTQSTFGSAASLTQTTLPGIGSYECCYQHSISQMDRKVTMKILQKNCPKCPELELTQHKKSGKRHCPCFLPKANKGNSISSLNRCGKDTI